MKNFKRTIYLTLALSALLSCSQIKHKESKVVSSGSEVQEFNQKEAIALAKEKLSKMVAQAKSSKNPYSKNYLASDLFLKASAAQAAGDYVTANLLYSNLLDLTNDVFVKTKYSVSLIRSGDLATAKKLLSEVLKVDPHNDKVALVLAGVETGLTHTKEARVIYKNILKRDKTNEDACVFLGKSYAMEDKFKEAISTLSKCEKHSKHNGVFSYYIGKIQIEKNQIKAAQKSFERSLKLQPDFSRSALALGIIHEEAGRESKAISIYKEYLKKNSQDKEVLSRLVQTLFTSERFSEVIPYAVRLSDLEPDNLNLKVKLGILYTDTKSYEKAISIFKELLAVAPSSDKILYYLGAIFQETKQFEDAIDTFGKISTSSALYQDSTVQIAHMMGHMANERFTTLNDSSYQQEFFKYIDQRIEEIPSMEVELRVVKAGYFESIGAASKAAEVLDKVKDDEKFTNKHMYYLASLHDQNDNLAQTEMIIQQILKSEPKNADALNFMGYVYVERGIHMDKAFEYIQQALKVKPNDGYIRDSLGWYFYRKGELKKAFEELDYASKKVPDDVTISKHMGIILKEMKKINQSKKFFIKALSLSKNEKEKAAIYQHLKELGDDRLPASEKLVKSESK